MTEKLKLLTALMMDQTKNSKLSSAQKDALTPPEFNTLVPDNRRNPPLDRGQYTKIGGMWNLKHEIRSPKFYEILTKK